jgi:hypothetical protein
MFFSTHIHSAIKTVLCANCRYSDALLPRSRIGDDAIFAKAFSKQDLTNNIVDMM